MGAPPPKDTKSRLRVKWPPGDPVEPEAEVLQPGDPGYEEADSDEGPIPE